MILYKKLAVFAAICLCGCLASCSACSVNPGIAPEISSGVPESSSQSDPAPETPASPSEVVNLLMSALRDLNTEEMSGYAYDSRDLLENFSLFGAGSSSGDENSRLATKKFLSAVTCEPVSESIDGDSARVQVDLRVPDISGSIASIAADILKKAALQTLTGRNPDIEGLLWEYLAKEADFENMDKVSTSAEITLTKRDGVWLVDRSALEDPALMEAITGGISEKLAEYGVTPDSIAPR